MKKFIALCLSLLLSLSLSAPVALCAGQEDPVTPVIPENLDPDEPIRPLNDDGEVPAGGVAVF